MTRMSLNSGVGTNRPRLHARWSLGWRAGLLLVALVLSVASSHGSEGDRASTGQCPPGEVCSPDTPSGLYFKGPDFGDEFIFPDHTVGITAVGGMQKIEIEDAGWGHLSDFDADCTYSAFSVEAIDPPFVRVHADAIGSSYLRILDPDNGELYDRLNIHSLPVQQVEVLSAAPSFLVQNWQNQATRLYYSGKPTFWLVRLKNVDKRLVDESLVFSVGDANHTAVINSTHWDRVEILPASDATRLEVTVTTGSGATGIGEVDLTFEIDRIEDDVEQPVPNTLDASQVLFVSFSGLTDDDRVVYGLDWTASAFAPGGATTDRATMFGAAMAFYPDQVGTWQLEVSAANVTRVYEIIVTPPQPAPPPPPRPFAGFEPEQEPELEQELEQEPEQEPEQDTERVPLATLLRGAPGWRAVRYRAAP